MPAEEELSRYELMALKEIAMTGKLTGKSTDAALLLRLFAQGSVAGDIGDLQLTGKGRSLLVRGSPALWDMAA